MPTQPPSPSECYQSAVRLVHAAEGSRTMEIQTTDALIAIVWALLAQAPRRARKRVSIHRDPGGLPPSLSWGDEQ